MKNRMWSLFAGGGALVLGNTLAGPVLAQGTEINEKPPMYTYVADWAIPRAKWGEMDKARGNNGKIFDKAVAGGSLVGYGDDTELVHQADGATHDNWWSSMSMAGLLGVLEEVGKAGPPAVINTATKHWDNIYVSRFYNWRAGTYHDVYTHTASYKLKADAASDAVEMLSKSLIVPLLEKLVADGTVVEYEIDELAVHTEAPGTFWITAITANGQGQDKLTAAIQATLKSNALAGPAFGSMVDFTVHRDDLTRTNATYK